MIDGGGWRGPSVIQSAARMKIYGYIQAMTVVGFRKIVTALSGQILANNLPSINPMETGPYVLESLENAALSPLIQTCPFGMTTCSVDGTSTPVGSTQMMSPGIPSTRLHTRRPGSIGDCRMIKSPRRTEFGKRRMDMRSSTTTSPETPRVGSMEGPAMRERRNTYSLSRWTAHAKLKRCKVPHAEYDARVLQLVA